MLTEEQLSENRRLCKIATENAKPVLKRGDRIRASRCPGRKVWFTFDHWDGGWIVTKSGISDVAARCIDRLNGKPVDFTITTNSSEHLVQHGA